MEITLIQTCGACPEQYDAVDQDGNLVGYLRLRHGYFQVRFPYVNGEVIYDAEPQGDGLFNSDERDFYLKNAIKAIKLKLIEKQLEEL